MNCYIPKADSQNIPQEVYESLAQQVDSITFVSSPEIVERDDPTRGQVIGRVRQQCIDLAVAAEEPFMMMNSLGALHTRPDNVRAMIEFLATHPDWGGVALVPGEKVSGRPKHICSDCVMLRLEAARLVKFNVKRGDCECISMAACIRKEFDYGYLEYKGGRLQKVEYDG